MGKLSQDSEEAKKFIKKNKNLLFEKFASDKIFKPNEKPISLFMAGSPGAGKTEYSKRFFSPMNETLSLSVINTTYAEVTPFIAIIWNINEKDK